MSASPFKKTKKNKRTQVCNDGTCSCLPARLPSSYSSSLLLPHQCDSMTASRRKVSTTWSLTCEYTFTPRTETQYCVNMVAKINPWFVDRCTTENNGSLCSSKFNSCHSYQTSALCREVDFLTTEALFSACVSACSVTGGELFEDIVAREYYSEADARYSTSSPSPRSFHLSFAAAAAAAAELHHDKNIFVWLFFLQICAAAPDVLQAAARSSWLLCRPVFFKRPLEFFDPNDSGLLNGVCH